MCVSFAGLAKIARLLVIIRMYVASQLADPRLSCYVSLLPLYKTLDLTASCNRYLHIYILGGIVG